VDQKIIYELVADRECNCGSEFLKRLISFPEQSDRRKFVPKEHDEKIILKESTGVSYTCPNCGLEWFGLLDKIQSGYHLRLKNEKGGSQSQLVHDEKMAIEVSEGKRIIDLLLELIISARILDYHHSQIKGVDLQRAKLTPPKNIIPLLSHLKAYFAESYSFQKTYHTIVSEGIPEQKRAEELFKKFKDQTRVVRGLRIYTQKEKNILPDIRWTPDSSYPVIDVDSVRIMESEASEECPTGYNNGSDQYYEHINEEYIDLFEVVGDHYSEVEWFVKKLINATIGEDSEAREDLEEWIHLKQEYIDKLP